MKRTVILFFLSIVVFTGTNYAIDADMYGDFGILTFWEKPKRFDNDLIGVYQDTAWNWHTFYGADSVELILNDWLPSGKLGIKFEAGQFGACIEFGIGKNAFDARMTGTNTTRKLYQRYGFYITANKWYAEWLINENFSLLLGQEYTPANFFSSNRLVGPQIGFANMGCLFIGSRPMFQVGISTKDNILEAKVAAVKVDTQTIIIRYQSAGKTYVNEVKAPKVEGSVQFSKDFSELFGLKAKVAGGYQTYLSFQYPDVNLEDPVKDDYSFDITSYLAAGELSLKLWRFNLLYSMFYGQNLGPYGIKIGVPSTFWRLHEYKYAKAYFPSHDRDTIIEDSLGMQDTLWSFSNSTVTEMSLILNVKLFDFLSIEGGFQEMFGEHEYTKFNELWLDRSNYSWYGQLEFTLFEYMKLTAETGFTKYGKYRGFGEFYYWGMGLGIDF